MFRNIKYILTDIEGTTSSISFVHEVLFPYFLKNIDQLSSFKGSKELSEIHRETEAKSNRKLSFEELLEQLKTWAIADEKIKPLKSAQGLIWKNAYQKGEIKGHVYEDVAQNLENWSKSGYILGVFSSGSITAQKLLFENSLQGNLDRFFIHNFDTSTGGKREVETYKEICKQIQLKPEEILFLSDIKEELEAAKEAGLETIQLIRENQEKDWTMAAHDFNEINEFLNT